MESGGLLLPPVFSASPWAPLPSPWSWGDQVIPPKDKWMELSGVGTLIGLFALMLMGWCDTDFEVITIRA